MSVQNNVNKVKKLIKQGIFVLVCVLTLHSGLLIFNYDLIIIHILSCFYALWLGLSLSKLFGLCFTHKLSIVFVFLMLMCIVLNRFNIFGNYLLLARILMFLFGLFCIGLLIYCFFKTNN